MLTFLKVDGLCYVSSEPELAYTPSKKAYVTFSVASNKVWTDDDKQKHEETCFIDCIAFGKLAEAIDKYVFKSDPIFIVGRLKQEKWEAQDGSKRQKHLVNVKECYFLKSKDD